MSRYISICCGSTSHVINHFLCITVVPRIIQPSADNHRENAYKSSSVPLTCSLNVNIPSSVTITWTNNNANVTMSPNKIIEIGNTNTTLLIRNLQLSDTGVYQCVFNDTANGWTLRKTISLLITGMFAYGINLMFILCSIPRKTINQLKHRVLMLYRKYTTQGGVSWQIQHSAMLCAVFATRSHPLYCTFHTALTAVL